MGTQGYVWGQHKPVAVLPQPLSLMGLCPPSGTPLPSSEMLVGDKDLFWDVAKCHRSLTGSTCPSLAGQMPGGSCGQSILVET